MAVILALFAVPANSFAVSTADSLESRIQRCAENKQIVDDLGPAFQQNPQGEFLLAPANKDLRFAIIIYNIDILPDKAIFSAGMAFRDVHSNQLIALKADNIVFSKTNGLIGPATLYLLNDIHFNLGNAIKISLKSQKGNGTFATMECKGLKEFGISGKAEFNDAYLLPCNDSGVIIPGKRMTTDFVTRVKKWNDLIVQISLPSFQIKGITDFIFKIQGATLDLSESSNIPGIAFPIKYNEDQILGAQPEIWEGFYLQKGLVLFPKHFHDKSNARLTAGIQNLLIDEFGFSGNIFVQNLLSFEKGRIAGWNISINEINVNLVFNTLESGSIKGDLGLPILPDTSRLGYFARIGINDNYLFSVGLNKNLTIPALKVAKLNLYAGSFVSAEIQKGNLTLIANLSGDLMASSAKNEMPFHFPKIGFQNLNISNKSPKFSIEYFGLEKSNDTSSFSKFPLSLNKISLKGKDNLYELYFDFGLNLTEYITADAGFTIKSEWQTVNNAERMVFKSFAVNQISVEFEKSGMRVNGRIDLFKEDIAYGNGFNGQVVFDITNAKIKGNAKALFGKIKNTRYWYFDAAILWGTPGIPVFPGVNINGFIGGAWHRMRPKTTTDIIANPQIGQTEMGPVFVPDNTAGLGLRAGVYLNGGSNASYQAKTIFEIQCNSNGGINNFMFYGDINIMPQELKFDKKSIIANTSNLPATGNVWTDYISNYRPAGKISGPFLLRFDFTNNSFSANTGIYINNIAQNKITGAGTFGKAGEISAFFSKEKWFVRVGTPTSPLSIKVNIDEQNGVSCGAYFNCGTELLNAPAAPIEVTQYLKYAPQMGEMRDLQAMAEGAGFAFGFNFKATATAGATDKKFSLYANLNSIAAADINLLKYNSSTICTQTGETPGIDGWYANGQLYTFLQGKLGAKAGKIQVDVLTLTGAMAMQCKAPNPFYADGKMYVEFNLGGFLKFNNTMDIKLGKSCDLQVIKYSDSSIIKRINPENNASNISPLTDVTIDFSIPVNTIFETPDGKTLKFLVHDPELKEGTNKIKGIWQWNENRTSIIMLKSEYLPPLKKLQLQVLITLVEIKNNKEIAVLFQGKPVQESSNTSFTTGKLPDNIPKTNVANAWPAINQINFFSKESKTCNVRLKIKQDNVFSIAGTKVVARFQDFKNKVLEENIVNYKNGILEFKSPVTLKGGDIFHLTFTRVSSSAPSAVGTYNSPTSAGPSTAVIAGAMGTPSPTGTGSGTTTTIKPTILLDYWFRNSQYNTFQEKLNDFQVKSNNLQNTTGYSKTMNLELASNKNEYFEPMELDSQITYQADGVSTPWIQSELKNKVYYLFRKIPVNKYLKRDTFMLGCPPLRALKLMQTKVSTAILDPTNVATGNPFVFQDKSVTIQYNLPIIAETDLEEIKAQLSSNLISGSISSTMVTEYIKAFGINYNPSTPPSAAKTISMPTPLPMTMPGSMATSVIFTAPVSTSTPSTSVISSLLTQLINLKVTPLFIPNKYGINFKYSDQGRTINKNYVQVFNTK